MLQENGTAQNGNPVNHRRPHKDPKNETNKSKNLKMKSTKTLILLYLCGLCVSSLISQAFPMLDEVSSHSNAARILGDVIISEHNEQHNLKTTEEVIVSYEASCDIFLDEYYGHIFSHHKTLKEKDYESSRIIPTLRDKDDISDITPGKSDRYLGNPLSGYLSFAHSPLINCYTENEKFDIAIVGATFDTGVSFRPGARFGPMGIRAVTKRMSKDSVSPFRKNFELFKKINVVDCGDPPMTPIDNRVALDQLYRAERAILKNKSLNPKLSSIPRVLTLGGDHTITLSCLRAVYEKWGKVSVIHFDSHLDTIDPYHMDNNVTEYAALNHGTFLHWAAKRGLISNNSNVHVGLRGYYENVNDTLRDSTIGFQRIFARDIDHRGTQGIVEQIKNRVGKKMVYISVDIDCLDPGFAPGTGTVEPGGFSTRELLTILDGLEGIPVVGADIVEVSPPYDSSEITQEAASEISRSLLGLMAVRNVN